MLKLPMVTLIELNCVDLETGVNSLLYSCQGIEFARIILFSHKKPNNFPQDKIEFVEIPKLSYDEACHFIVHNIQKYIDTEFYLSIHTDGFVINPHLWQKEFLNYDYIGAPWPKSQFTAHRVGNGGFTLRSRKLLNLCSAMSFDGPYEDRAICHDHRKHFEDNGCIFAPVEIAMKFSLETPIEECECNLDNTFGFHGKAYSKKHIFFNDMIQKWNANDKL
jgi:hypothetical protein